MFEATMNRKQQSAMRENRWMHDRSPQERRASCAHRSRSLSAGGTPAGSHPSTLQACNNTVLEFRRTWCPSKIQEGTAPQVDGAGAPATGACCWAPCHAQPVCGGWVVSMETRAIYRDENPPSALRFQHDNFGLDALRRNKLYADKVVRPRVTVWLTDYLHIEQVAVAFKCTLNSVGFAELNILLLVESVAWLSHFPLFEVCI